MKKEPCDTCKTVGKMNVDGPCKCPCREPPKEEMVPVCTEKNCIEHAKHICPSCTCFEPWKPNDLRIRELEIWQEGAIKIMDEFVALLTELRKK